MQLVRKREHADEVRDLLRALPATSITVTDYAVHSLILLMKRFNMLDELPAFVAHSGFGTTVALVDVPPGQFARIVDANRDHRLDVDDAYHYVSAELHGLTLVSLDADFDRTPRGRLTPAAALQRFVDEQRQQQSQQPPPPGTPQP
jgi:predicted nucleic acid-binding protein